MGIGRELYQKRQRDGQEGAVLPHDKLKGIAPQQTFDDAIGWLRDKGYTEEAKRKSTQEPKAERLTGPGDNWAREQGLGKK